MKSAAATVLFVSVLTLGIFTVLVGDKVRGENGKGEVHQEMMNPNHHW